MRYVVGHFLHVFTYILLTRVQLFIDKPRPFAQIEIDAGAHAQIFRGFKTHRFKHKAIHTLIQHTTNHSNSKNKYYLGLTTYLFDREAGEVAVDNKVGELRQVLHPELFQQVSLGPQAVQQNVETIAATARNNNT